MDKHKVKKNSKKVELYFKEKKKKKRRKKIAFVSLIIVIATGIFLFKSPIFNIEKVIVKGNKMLKEVGVVNKKEIEGKNIFLLDTNIIKDKVSENPYIESVSVKRADLNSIEINIKERKMFYKVIHEEKVYILNNQLYIMDVLEDDKELALVSLSGIIPDSLAVGSRIVKNDEIAKIAEDVGVNLIDKQKESIFSNLNLIDKSSISIYVDDIKIILGNPINLDYKYQKAMEIINSENIKFKHGYIDVSVLEHPVVKFEEEVNKEEKEEIKNQNEEIEIISVESEGAKNVQVQEVKIEDNNMINEEP